MSHAAQRATEDVLLDLPALGVQLIHKGGEILDSLKRWELLARPKRAIHWADHRSAMECAHAWLGGTGLPPEIEAVLSSHPDFQAITLWDAEPEVRVAFDDFGGEPANVDVLMIAHDSRGPFVVAIEAKADESFGRTLKGPLSVTAKKLRESPRSKGVARIERLMRLLIERSPAELESASLLRYQLLTASAAAL